MKILFCYFLNWCVCLLRLIWVIRPKQEICGCLWEKLGLKWEARGQLSNDYDVVYTGRGRSRRLRAQQVLGILWAGAFWIGELAMNKMVGWKKQNGGLKYHIFANVAYKYLSSSRACKIFLLKFQCSVFCNSHHNSLYRSLEMRCHVCNVRPPCHTLI